MSIGFLELKHRIRQWQTKAVKLERRRIQVVVRSVIAAGVIAGALLVWRNSEAPPVMPKQHLSPESKVETPAALPPAAALLKTHQVVSGETISAIAAQYDLDVETVQSANPSIGAVIHPGDELVILPQKGALHVVDMGDTLWRLSIMYGVTVESIITANNKPNEKIVIGEKLFIPGGKLSRAATPVSRGATARFLWPAYGEFSSPFGYRWGRLHAGIDIANDIGTPIRAARAGQVLSTGWDGGYGYTIVIDHGQDYSTLYGHLDSYAVTPGQYVQTGQFIGRMGNTGNSTGPHLHFEVRVNNKPVNPMNYLN